MQNVDVVGKTVQGTSLRFFFKFQSRSRIQILVTVTSPHTVNVKQMQNTPQKQNKIKKQHIN